MLLTVSERAHLNELRTKGSLTSEDILYCIRLWRLKSMDPTLQIGRWKTDGLPQSLYELQTLALSGPAQRPALSPESLLQIIEIGEKHQLRAHRTIMPSASDAAEVISVVVAAAHAILTKIEHELDEFLTYLRSREQLENADLLQSIAFLSISWLGDNELGLAIALKRIQIATSERRSALSISSLIEIGNIADSNSPFRSKTFTALYETAQRIIHQRHHKAKGYLSHIHDKTSLQYGDILQCIDLWHDGQNVTSHGERILIPANESCIVQLQEISTQKHQHNKTLNVRALTLLLKINKEKTTHTATIATPFATEIIASLAHAAITMLRINGETINRFLTALKEKKQLSYTDFIQCIDFLRYLESGTGEENLATTLENIVKLPQGSNFDLGAGILGKIIEICRQNSTVSKAILTTLIAVAQNTISYLKRPSALTFLSYLQSETRLNYSDIIKCIDLWHSGTNIIDGKRIVIPAGESRMEKLQKLDISEDEHLKPVSIHALRQLREICSMEPILLPNRNIEFATDIFTALAKPVAAMLDSIEKHEQVEQERIGKLAMQIVTSSSTYPAKKITDFAKEDRPKILEYLTTNNKCFVTFLKYQLIAVEAWQKERKRQFYNDIANMGNAMMRLINEPRLYAFLSTQIAIDNVRPSGRRNYLIIVEPHCRTFSLMQEYVQSVIYGFKTSIITAYAHGKLPEMMDLMLYDDLCIGEKVRSLHAFHLNLCNGITEMNTKMQKISTQVTQNEHSHGGFITGNRAVDFFHHRLNDQRSYQVKDERTGEIISIVPDRNYICWYLDTILAVPDIPKYSTPAFCIQPTKAKPRTR